MGGTLRGAMKGLLTGASGFLGSHIAEQLVAQGHQVRCLVRRSSKTDLLKTLGVEFAEGAVDQPATLGPAVRGVDAVIHSAGVVKARSAAEFDQINHQGTRALLDAAVAEAPGLQRFVHIGSLAAFGPSPDGVPRAGDDDPRPVTEYGRSKLAAERAVLAYREKLPVVVLRPAAIYGPRDTEMYAFFQMVASRVVLRLGKGTETVSVVYGPDCAAAAVRALTADVPSGSAYFVDDGRPWHYDEMVQVLERATERKVIFRASVPMPIVRSLAYFSEQYGRIAGKAMMFTRDKCNDLEALHQVCDSARSRAELGWTPSVTFAEGAPITARWYRAQGML